MVSYTLNNSAVNAKPFSITGQDVFQPSYAQSRLSAIVGGPLVLGKLVKDPATFFNFTYFATRAKNPYTAVATVPTALERDGNFGQVPIFDPSTHILFPGGAIPAFRFDPIAQKLLAYIPLPNQPGLVNNYEFETSAPQDSNNLTLRLQRSITKKDRLSGHFSYQSRQNRNAQPFQFFDTTAGSGLSSDIQWTRNLTASLIGNVQVTFNRNRNQTNPYFANGTNVASELGIAGTSQDPVNYGPPNLNFTNFGALSDASASLTRNQSQTVGGNVISLRGPHNLTFGMQYARNDLSARTDPNGRGTFNFTGVATSELDARGFLVNGTGFDFADYLLGLPQSSSIRYGDSSTYFLNDTVSTFAQDDWKVNARLSLNFGLRYEFISPFREKYGHLANLSIAPDLSAVTVVTPGVAGVPSGLVNPDYKNFAPRFGLAWKMPKIKRSTIVRAGYGIYYNGQAYNAFPSRLAQQPPFAVSSSVNTGPLDELTLAQGFVQVAPNLVTNTYAVDPNYRTPYVQTWNLAIQHELPKGFFVEVGYLGTKGTRLDVQTIPRIGSSTGFTYDSSVGDSVYHGLQVRLNERFRRGISLGTHYTYSKSIDDSSSFGGAGNTVAQNYLDLRAERGLSSFDRRHVFDSNWVLTSQVGSAGSRFAPDGMVARLFREWTLSGGLTTQTGTPLTARVLGNGAKLAQTGAVGSGRADSTGQDLSSSVGFFNLAAFAVPLPGRFGDAGRNTIQGPGSVSMNLNFGRAFALGESRRRLEMRVEANNVLNHVNFTNINTVVNAINYGLPVSASGMRTLSLVARLRF